MVNEEKVRLMARAASFEAGEGKRALSMNRFFRGDFIGLKLIGAWVAYTVAFCLCVGLWAFYRMEYLMSNINSLDLPAMGKDLAFLYLSLLGIFLLIHYIVFYERYQQNRKILTAYNRILKRLSHIYQSESKSGSGELTSKGAKEHEDFTGI